MLSQMLQHHQQLYVHRIEISNPEARLTEITKLCFMMLCLPGVMSGCS